MTNNYMEEINTPCKFCSGTSMCRICKDCLFCGSCECHKNYEIAQAITERLEGCKKLYKDPGILIGFEQQYSKHMLESSIKSYNEALDRAIAIVKELLVKE